MRLSILMASCCLLAACSQPASKSASTLAETPPVVLAGVDLGQPLRAIGTEPFWGVAVEGDTLTWSGIDQANQTAANPGPVLQGTTAVFRTVTAAGVPLVLTLIATECSDGMSDRTYPLTARAELGEQAFNGCAASQTFLDTTPRP